MSLEADIFNLVDEILSSEDLTLMEILKEVAEESANGRSEWWDAILEEIDPENPVQANTFLTQLLGQYKASKEDPSIQFDFAANAAIIHVALHNALGCSKASEAHSNSKWRHRIPCTNASFKIFFHKGKPYLLVKDEHCPFTQIPNSE